MKNKRLLRDLRVLLLRWFVTLVYTLVFSLLFQTLESSTMGRSSGSKAQRSDISRGKQIICVLLES